VGGVCVCVTNRIEKEKRKTDSLSIFHSGVKKALSDCFQKLELLDEKKSIQMKRNDFL